MGTFEETLEKRKKNLHEAIVSVMKDVKNID